VGLNPETGQVKMAFEMLPAAFSLVGMEGRLAHTHWNSQPDGYLPFFNRSLPDPSASAPFPQQPQEFVGCFFFLPFPADPEPAPDFQFDQSLPDDFED
jgi:hypothetical protein